MRRLRTVSRREALRNCLVVLVAIAMAVASSGAIGAWAGVPAAGRSLPIRQSDDNGDLPTIALTVTSTLDEVDADPGDGVCASAASRCTLRAAVMEANLRGGHHTINVPAGTYTLTRTDPIPTPDNADADDPTSGDAVGDLNVRTNVTIRGAGSASTIIDADGKSRIVEVIGGRTLALHGVTLKRGRATGDGGAILSNGDVRLTSAIVADSASKRNGGAIRASRADLVDSTIVNNRADGDGGAVSAVFLEARSSIMAGNSSDAHGGAVYSTRHEA